jgi:hypothetical protein
VKLVIDEILPPRWVDYSGTSSSSYPIASHSLITPAHQGKQLPPGPEGLGHFALYLVAIFLAAAASPLVAWFCGNLVMVPVTVALSFSFFIGSLGTQHGARLAREMLFGRKAIASIAGSIGFPECIVSIRPANLGSRYAAAAAAFIFGACRHA